uniref:piggyBac transposable element-derived protein 4-like n=1 Tax=Epinephelus lanceolatus TaxID=310571 RepID=UPI00144508EC|nr:piggyBac transposable element-derived protein 4-like [Epinephelus lanceolatus]
MDDSDEAAPTPPRFFPKRPPGVQLPFNLGNPSPGEIFCRFVDAEVLQHLVECTNKKAATNQEKGKTFVWTPVSTDELKKFIGLLLYMSVVQMPQLSDYWRQGTIFHQPYPATVMSRDRFRLILSNLHMSDPKADAENDAMKGTENYDPIHRVRSLLNMVRMRCLSFYHPKQHLAVDERMVATKARLGIKQYMKAKPTKWGLKLFVLADVNGYTVNYILYTGKGTTPVSGNGLSFDVVVELVKKEHLGTGYIIYTDNFYTSPLLFRHLIQEGFGVCGTYREGRIGVPKTKENALDKRASRGSIRWIRDGDLLFIKWKDTREVSLCSSVHPVYSGDMVERWQKTGEQHRRVSIPRPTAVTEYNKYMGGVDTSDQMLGTRSVHRKTKRWTTTVFQHLVDICVTNSFIIHKEVCANQQQAHMTRQQFQEELTAHLLGTPLKVCPPPPPATHHYPDPTSSGNPASQRSTKGRRICKLCKRCTSWMCKLCNAPLCLQPDRNCFKQFHTEQ